MSVDTNTKPLSPTRRLRMERGLTREQLAVRAGVSSSTVYLVERAGILSPSTASKLAAALGVDPVELRP